MLRCFTVLIFVARRFDQALVLDNEVGVYFDICSQIYLLQLLNILIMCLHFVLRVGMCQRCQLK